MPLPSQDAVGVLGEGSDLGRETAARNGRGSFCADNDLPLLDANPPRPPPRRKGFPRLGPPPPPYLSLSMSVLQFASLCPAIQGHLPRECLPPR